MGNLSGGTLQLTYPNDISRGTRARRANADIIDLTNLQWSELVAEFDHRCVYCGKYCRNPTQDHLLPLSRGGNHTKTNVVPACGACNSRKNGMTLEEFARVADTTKFHPRLLETRLMAGNIDSLTQDVIADVVPSLIAAHSQTMTIHIIVSVPNHEPRKSDPHYHVFNETRTRLKKLNALNCWVGNRDCNGIVELHHDKCEFSLANDIDVEKFNAAYGLHLTDDNAFLDYINSEGGLLALCVQHHRGHLGIHSLPYPLWVVQKYLRDGINAPAHQVLASELVHTTA